MKTNYKTSISVALLGLLGLSNVANAQNIACGGWHSLAICSDSTVKAFGENATGEIGNGNTTDQPTPTTVPGLTGIMAVSAGGDQLEAHSMALKSNGNVYCWGSNLYGGLGNASATGTFVTAPVQALIISNVKAISAGGWHSVALKNDGTVWCWGWNADGQLGDGTLVDKSIPTQVPGLTGIVKIAAGTYHVLALKNDGTVWAWGDNVSGQIGDGTVNTDKSSPVQVSGLTGVVNIASGRFFSLAVKNDGTVWTWGENLYGQLGNGTVANSSTPVQVSGLTGITSAVAATGAFHCMAVKSDGTIWSWGRNTYGNLGDNTLTNHSTPVQMTGITSAVGLAAGTNFSLLYKADGTMWGCGRNLSGQLGDGTVAQHNVATQSGVICSILQPPVPVGIKKQGAASHNDISVFPNPSSNGKFNIELTQIADHEIEIYNAVGQKVFQTQIDQQAIGSPFSIDLSEQANGIYYLTIRSQTNTVSKKLIKQ